MQFSSEGYIIKVKNHGEKSLIITVVCPSYGKIVGFVNNGNTKKNISIYQIGNYVSFNAYARIEENMLSLKGVELIKSNSAEFMFDANKTEVLISMCKLLDSCVAEKDNLGDLYTSVSEFFSHINYQNWLVYYSFFEFNLLNFLGIGLDIRKCAVTGKTSDLQYISPKTGRAVCEEIGAPYKNKLYKYPHYIINKNYLPSQDELLNTLQMTGNFLTKNFLQNHNLKLSINRSSLQNMAKLYHKM